jgi:hypothetical protein
MSSLNTLLVPTGGRLFSRKKLSPSNSCLSESVPSCNYRSSTSSTGPPPAKYTNPPMENEINAKSWKYSFLPASPNR